MSLLPDITPPPTAPLDHPNGLPPSADAQARLLILIDAFSETAASKGIEGRMKLAKLDFLLRYPDHFNQLMADRRPDDDPGDDPWLTGAIEQSMIRYRYGPWDPAYYALLGALTGKGLVEPRHENAIATYRTTPAGRSATESLAASESWRPVRERARLLRRHFNLSGNKLKDLIYQAFPDIVEADWGTQL
ncbi:hypothetical protein [Streptomyces sp. NBC_01637]|uniref:hypothetical protein n=1 Tax=unclassified Streptomyces TaxID=2593676 RepID=UPI003870662A|nr:hypothetical protein OH719_00025 [Streptomyces sp. NBC_01653]WTC84626.1 hypothetical protein OH719_46845 [Streptomyces sp. NBC_01653]WTD86242.1 hypothetical protein OG891_00025 [Streptomyces sp. NBC_01637]WTD94283.1 hypothetical protein OG891_46840 [Streptomyces sp. NBC_01637]